MIYYFSSTGNSRALATTIAQHLNDKAVDIVPLLHADESPSLTLGPTEKLGFVFPIYGWSLPDIVRTFLESLRIEGYNRQYVYFAVTCGDDVGVADRPIRKVFSEAGLHLDAGYSVTMPDSYVCLPGFDVDKPEERESKFARFRPRVKEIAEQVLRRAVVMDIHRGCFPWLKTNVLGWYFRKFLITDKPFRTTSDCISCGLCAKVCPMHNITVMSQESNVQWHGHCTGCLACYHHCPTRAIRFGKRTEKKGQYLYSKYCEST
ncbi:MAG: EFR1 family ferrodoxin [Bacteroidaceae bacterium]|nr:EFR1 family ferrodoxin [Bacteroidaceae bacterium]